MAIVGIGTDVVSVSRFRALIAHGGERFLRRWFGTTEMLPHQAHLDPAPRAAAAFAAKEATLKAMRVRGEGPLRWREIEVTADAAGQLRVRVIGTMADLADYAGIARFHLSVSLQTHHAIAMVIAEATTGPDDLR